MTKKELLEKFKPETKEIEVKAWGANVSIKKLTIKEANDVQSMLMNNATTEELQTGKLEISVGKLQQSQWLAVSYALVEPKLTIDEISGLSTDGQLGIAEIYEALQAWDKPKK